MGRPVVAVKPLVRRVVRAVESARVRAIAALVFLFLGTLLLAGLVGVCLVLPPLRAAKSTTWIMPCLHTNGSARPRAAAGAAIPCSRPGPNASGPLVLSMLPRDFWLGDSASR